MKFFLDTANIEDIISILPLGIVHGITTNPTILSREMSVQDFSPRAHYQQIIDAVGSLPVSLEVVSTTTEAMCQEARELAAIAPSVVVKIPCNTEGIKTVAKLSAEGIKTNCTLVFSLVQAVSAMQAGATYISPFIGRLEDQGESGLGLVNDCVQAKIRYGFGTEIICTSIRNINHITECIRLGADIVTCTPEYFAQLVNHPLTDKGLAQFLSDYNAAKQ